MVMLWWLLLWVRLAIVELKRVPFSLLRLGSGRGGNFWLGAESACWLCRELRQSPTPTLSTSSLRQTALRNCDPIRLLESLRAQLQHEKLSIIVSQLSILLCTASFARTTIAAPRLATKFLTMGFTTGFVCQLFSGHNLYNL